MGNEQVIKSFGYTEMYEWAKVPDANKLGSFVQFSTQYPDKVELFTGSGKLLGVSTICSTITSDNPDEWPKAYKCDPVGDIYMQKETLAVGAKVYDQDKELSYIETKPYEHYVKIPADNFDKSVTYTKRTARKEWVRINMLGKVIVRDNGKCVPGEYCTPYVGEDMEFVGTAQPATADSKVKFYVLMRYSNNSIMIVNNSIVNYGQN